MTKRISSLLLLAAFAVMPSSGAFAAAPEKNVRIDEVNLAKLCPEDQQRALYIAERLEVITNTDRSDLNAAERKALRQEARGLKHEADVLNKRAGGTVIYLSTAGVIIILLILIILL